MAAMVEHRSLALPGQRKLRYALYGHKDLQKIVLYVHGFPGSRLEPSFAATVANEAGLTIVAPDRPSFGGSDAKHDLTFTNWAEDIAALLAELRVQEFFAIGVSGGAPYVLGLGAAFGPRVKALHVISGMAPLASVASIDSMALPNRLLLGLARRVPLLAFPLGYLTASVWRMFPSFGIWWLRTFMGKADEAYFRSPEFVALMRANLIEALPGSSAGAARELLRLASPWVFDLKTVTCPVQIWHGEMDAYVPPELGRALARAIPQAQLTLVPKAGHLLAVKLLPEILRGRSVTGNTQY